MPDDKQKMMRALFVSHTKLAFIGADTFTPESNPGVKDLIGYSYVDLVNRNLVVSCEGVCIELDPELAQYWRKCIEST